MEFLCYFPGFRENACGSVLINDVLNTGASFVPSVCVCMLENDIFIVLSPRMIYYLNEFIMLFRRRSFIKMQVYNGPEEERMKITMADAPPPRL
jgi:hypothetical protein